MNNNQQVDGLSVRLATSIQTTKKHVLQRAARAFGRHGINIYGYGQGHDWQPAAVGTFLALVDGVTEFAMRAATGLPLFTTYTSATVGDIICFWMYGFAAAWILRRTHVRWLGRKPLAALAAIGSVSIAIWEVLAVHDGSTQELSPTHIYHTIIFPFMLTWLLMGALIVIRSGKWRSWSFVVMMLALAGWAACVGWDFRNPPAAPSHIIASTGVHSSQVAVSQGHQ